MTLKAKNKKDFVSPIKVNDNVWFYPMPKRFEFIIQVKINGATEFVMFEISRKKLKKLLLANNK